MPQLKYMDREELFRQAEAIHEGYVAGLNCAERVFLTVRAFVETDIPPEAVALLSGLGGGVGNPRRSLRGGLRRRGGHRTGPRAAQPARREPGAGLRGVPRLRLSVPDGLRNHGVPRTHR